MENYDRTMELIDTAYDSAGRSSEQFSKYQDTLEYKIKQLQNTWEQFRTQFFNSEFFKNIVDGLNKILNLVKDFDLKQILSLGVIGITLGKSVITNFTNELQKGTHKIQSTWSKALQYTTSTGIKGFMKGAISKQLIQELKTFDSKKYLRGAGDILGSKRQDAPQMVQQVEVQKTQELQKQLQLYSELSQKRSELAQKAMIERQTDEQISSETLNQIRLAQQERTEKLKMLNNLSTELGYEQQITAQNANQLAQKMQEKSQNSNTMMAGVKTGIGNAASSALSTGITTALMTAISGADLTTVLKTAGMAALSAAIPAIISAIMPVIISVLTGPVGLGIALTATIVGVIVSIDKAAEKARKAELERLSKIEDANKELQKENDDIINSYKKSIKEEEKLKKAIENVQKLQNKKFLTESEQTTLDEAASYLKENYEEVIEEDELTGHFTIIETKLSEIEENTAKDQQNDIANIYKNIVKQQKNIEDRTAEREDLIFSMQEAGFTGLEGQIGYDIGNDFVEFSENGKIVYANVSSAFEQVKDELSDLKTIYGEELNLNEIFGMSDFEDLLDSNLEPYELIEQLEKNGITTQDIEKAVVDIEKKLADIDKNQTTEAKKTAVEDTLLLQGWDETAAKIASYASKDFEIGTNTDVQNEIKKAIAGENKEFLEAIKDNNLKGLFGDKYTNYEKAFQMLGYGKGQEKQLSDLFSSGTNLVEWNDLSEEMQDAISDLTDETLETWDKDGFFGVANRKESKITTDVLMKVLAAQMIEAAEIWTEENQQLLENNKENFVNLSQHMIDSSNKTWKEYQADVNNIINNQADEEVKNAMIEYRDTAEDSIYRQWNGYVEQLKNISGTNKGIKDEIINKLDFASIQYFTKQLSSLDLSQYGYDKIANYINTNFRNLNENALNVLANIPIEELSSLTLSSSQEYIEKLTKATNDASLAQQIFYDYIQQMKLVTMSGVFVGKDSTQILKEQYQEEIKGFNEKYSSIFKANEEMLENQALSSETYFQLIEEGFSDYVDITSDGYMLIQDKAEEAWTQMALSPLKDLREKISEQDAFIKEAESYISDLSGTLEVSLIDTTLLGLDINDVEYATNSYATVSMDKLISSYATLREEKKDTSKYEIIFGDKIDFVNKMIDEGYDSLEEYIQALKEGKIALSEMEPDTWIQGLENLKEAIGESENKIKELKEELADLNEQLTEDQGALNEAEDALRQAIHGSDDFQSSLDGLVNYTNKIERLDKAIEKTKASLEDVSNIDEAKGLLSQLDEQYNDKTITLGAENIAIDKALNNLQSTLLQNYGNYISFDSEGNPLIDYAYMKMDANDEIRKAFEEEYNLYNEYRTKKEDNLDALNAIEREREERQKEALDNFVSEQEKLISILKEKAQEEIDVTKEKYEALEEADNDYLDALEEAINKQRELRDRQNQYEDLVTKEKKLALLQRDTSGANRKEAMSLANEIEDDRQNLLDSEVDNLIDSMKELYEKQKEARDAEIEYMETVTDNAQYFADWASNIMASWQSVEDMQAWYLENDPEAQDMTVEQTEAYLNQIEESWSNLVEYAALSATDFTTQQEDLTNAMNSMYENTGNNIENIGTITQEIAQKAADDLISEATRARDDALDKMNETQKKIEETKQKLAEEEQNAAILHKAAMEEMVKASESAMSKVSAYATKTLAEMTGFDLSDREQAEAFGKQYHFLNSKGEATSNFRTAISNAGGDANWFDLRKESRFEVWLSPNSPSAPSQLIKTFTSQEEAQRFANNPTDSKGKSINYNGTLSVSNPNNLTTGTFHGIQWADGTQTTYPTKEKAQQVLNAMSSNEKKKHGGNPKVFKTGGIVDYTGPAWVDGTPMKPEAFLSADDTKRIGEAAKILANLPIFNSTTNAQNAVSTNVGDTTIEIHINVENIESDYDVDQMIERVKKDIVDVSKPTGTPVILRR